MKQRLPAIGYHKMGRRPKLRAKLEPNPAAPALLLSAAGRGYRLAAGR